MYFGLVSSTIRDASSATLDDTNNNPDSNMNWNVHFQSFVIEGRDKLKSLDHYSLFTIQIGIGNNVVNGEGSRFIINNINNVDKLTMRPGLLLTLIDLNNKYLMIQLQSTLLILD
ncbi:hypothetical protein V1477_007999 [Vespula maculifrons]|uniref:Uncharacterized protein n=1 Tax=Vespula maculifrons TaxID=7453 RepID=A0ABD2CF94_VESMC